MMSPFRDIVDKAFPCCMERIWCRLSPSRRKCAFTNQTNWRRVLD